MPRLEHVEVLAAKVTELQTIIDGHEKEQREVVRKYQGEVRLFSELVVTHKEKATELQRLLARETTRLQAVRKELNNVKKDVTEKQNAIDALNEQGKNDQVLLQKARDEASSATRKLERCDTNREKLAAQMENKATHIERATAVFEKEKKRLVEAKKEAVAATAAATSHASDLEAEIERLTNELRERDAEIKKLNSHILFLEGHARDVNDSLEGHARDVNDLTLALATAKEKADKEKADKEKAERQLLIVKSALKKRSKSSTLLKDLRSAIGVDTNRGLPPRDPPSDGKRSIEMWQSRSVRHVGAVVKGRGAELVAKGIALAHGQKGLFDLVKSKRMQPIVRSIVKSALDTVQQRLDVKCGLYLQTFLDLSRSKYERLTHAISDYYNPATQKYDWLVAWQNPHNEKDQLHVPRLPSRYPVEKERDRVYGACQVHESEDGHVERDFEICAAATYTKYWHAMRDDISEDRPAQVLTFTDGTGGSRGTGLLHTEVGVGDWAAGKALSRLSIDPGALGEFKENNDGIRKHMCGVAAESVNRMIKRGTLTINPEGVGEKQIPIMVDHCGDMQFHKYAAGKKGSTHPVWCDCIHLDLPEEDRCIECYEDITEWHTEINCVTSTDAKMHIQKHLSIELTYGKPFEPFGCPCGWKSGNESKYRKYRSDFDALSDAEKKEKRKEHYYVVVESAKGEIEYPHGFCELLMEHVFLNPGGMSAHSPDPLHLTNINLFKQVLSATIFTHCSDEQTTTIEIYLKAVGFPVKLKREDGVDPTDGWIGRDCAKMIDEAHLHFPHLLHLAHCPDEFAGAALAAVHNAACSVNDDEDEVADEDEDLDFIPTEEEVAQEEAEEPAMMLAAKTIDAFMDVMYEQRPFERDDLEYRKARTVPYFKAQVELKRLLNKTDVAAKSTISHVAITEVVRQMVSKGDPGRRSCNVNEAFGAKLKWVMRNLVCRRPPSKKAVKCKRRKLNVKNPKMEKWLQTFTAGRIKQTFRRVCLYRKLIDDPAYEHLLQRKDVAIASTGFGNAKVKSVKPERLDSDRIVSRVLTYTPPKENPRHPLFDGSDAEE